MKKRIFSLFFVSALAMGLLSCAYLQTQQRQLAEKLVRLHVVANSDSPSDQAIKLRVRDAVLAAAEPVLGDTKSAFSAVVRTPDGNPVKLRKRACKTENLYWKVQSGETVLVERQKGEWSLVTAICTDGVRRRAWMMSRYLEG